MNDLRVGRRLGAGILSIAFVVAACGSAAAPVTSPPDDGSGTPVDPGVAGAKRVVPKPGQLDVRAVPADTLTATADGSTITVTATWTSGVEPCNVLDTVVVDRGEGTFSITLREISCVG